MENLVVKSKGFLGSKLSWVYFWLAVTLVPTILGSWFVINSPEIMDFYTNNFIITAVLYLVVMLVLAFCLYIIENENIKMSFVMLMALFVGMFLGPIINIFISSPNAVNIFMYSIGTTVALLVVLSIIGSNKDKDFSFLSAPLLVSFFVIVALFIVSAIYSGFGILSIIISLAIITWSSVSIVMEVNILVRNEDSSISECVIGVYLSVINIFINMLNLLK